MATVQYTGRRLQVVPRLQYSIQVVDYRCYLGYSAVLQVEDYWWYLGYRTIYR